jgi:hypothetical protein
MAEGEGYSMTAASTTTHPRRRWLQFTLRRALELFGSPVF